MEQRASNFNLRHNSCKTSVLLPIIFLNLFTTAISQKSHFRPSALIYIYLIMIAVNAAAAI